MIGILGLNYKTASIDIRDLFNISAEHTLPVAEDLMQNTRITGIVILATCNRTEIYYSCKADCPLSTKDDLVARLHKALGIRDDYSKHFYHYTKEDAIQHLFSVTSGINSMVIGENQIVSQIKNAYLTSTEANLTDAVLMRIFQKSFECSKRVRSETAIQQGATSVGYVAIDLCEKEATNFTESHVLVVGTGETGLLSLKNLGHRGVRNISITNRTNAKAEELAQEFKVKALPFEQFKEHLHTADIVIAATNAGKYLLHAEDIQQAQAKRNGRKQWLIDLSVPRNIDKEAAHIAGVQLYSIDDLQSIVDSYSEKRKLSIDKAKRIIEELVSESVSWINSRSLRPIISNITHNLQAVSKKELAEYRKHMQPETADEVEKYTALLTQKYIRTLIRNLKEATQNGSSAASLDLINELFDFDLKDEA